MISRTLKDEQTSVAQKIDALRKVKQGFKLSIIEKAWSEISTEMLESIIFTLYVPHDIIRMEVYDVLAIFLQHSQLPSMVYLEE